MTRSLIAKLTLAFLFVSLAGVVMSSILIQSRTRSEFDRFILRQNTAELVGALQASYAARGSWQGCEQVFHAFESRAPQSTPAAAGGSPGADWGHDNPALGAPPGIRFPLSLVSTEGRVVCGPQERLGQRVDQSTLRNSMAIEVDGKVVGYLVAGPLDQRRSPEQIFLRQINSSILTGGALGVLLALALGAILARTLTRPIRELTDAARRIAHGELGYQVKVRSQDEMGSLATAFNRMSADLAASNLARKQMTADIAHDLRTPLSLILGYTEALSDGKLPGTPEIFAVMHQEANHLNRLIDDLRLISLADAGELPLNRVPISPATLIERAEAAFKPRAAQKGVTLQAEIAAGLPEISVDPERMAQVLGNLTSNALRFTPENGHVTLFVRQEGGEILLGVGDTGPGVAPEDLPHIFDRFYRGDKSRRAGDESGLGLTIARSLVEAHGGRITVDSAAGQGATFTIRIPVNQV